MNSREMYDWAVAQRNAAGVTDERLSLAERVVELEDSLRQGMQLVLEAQDRARSIAKRCQQLQDEVRRCRKLQLAVDEYLTCYTERLGEMKKAHALHALRQAADSSKTLGSQRGGNPT